MKYLFSIVVIGLILLSLSWISADYLSDIVTSETKLMDFKVGLGMEVPSHYVNDIDPAKSELGRQLINEGRADTPQGKSSYISRFYICTSCHNTVREDPDLSLVNSDARLDFAITNNLPYLQASTFWGIVNREVWYNDDYVKKYGDLVVEANKSLEASIQLCAQECSQGRVLEDWEMEAILHYLTSLELKMADLATEEEIERLNSNELSLKEKQDWVQSKFLPRSPATFSEPPSDKQAGYGIIGDLVRGRAIYELGCQHCHREDGVSDLVLDDSRKNFKWLKNNITSDSRYSIYEIIRHGTYAEYGHREYMPLYTQEKMTDRQVEDLRAYIESMAE